MEDVADSARSMLMPNTVLLITCVACTLNKARRGVHEA